ncbi:hypothetical protein ACPOL_6733 (plasmid) [Acidisarcina polymorpha]|uniref:Uncharacterized protein n=2 Tax=Acidisarcina polymorpha TaxID=2211140 RepID=A0A2Z5GBD1_9BACT|nr:hypothetical protein ACPOL_6733 [Acidisarcina polymorpha]
MEWNSSYAARFDHLRKGGVIEPSFPDSEKIYEAVKDKLDPRSIAKDKAREVLIKKLLPRVAFIVEWSSTPFAEGLKVFLSSSETASDYDELRLANDDVQRSIERKLGPYLQSDWKATLNAAIIEAAPELRNP